jgi:hypothetical protein
MFKKIGSQSAVWLLIGLVAGLGIAVMFQAQPSYATATDRNDEFAIATGPLTNDFSIEAVYLLDFKTGSLFGTAMSKQTGQFQQLFRRDIAKDFGLKAGQKPKFIMCTGLMQISKARVPIYHVLYVGEVSTGNLAAYYMPYRGEVPGATTSEELQLLHGIPFRPQGNIRAQ